MGFIRKKSNDLFWKILNSKNIIKLEREKYRYGIKTGLNDVFLISNNKKMS